ncbi:hypothetical protein ABBQ32_010220 [Trebouxia sp. C0010 RCD-2024]
MLCQPRSGDFSRWTDRLFFFFFFFFGLGRCSCTSQVRLASLTAACRKGMDISPVTQKKKKKKKKKSLFIFTQLRLLKAQISLTQGSRKASLDFFFFFFFLGGSTSNEANNQAVKPICLHRTMFFFFFWVTGEMSIPFRQAAVKDARRT